MKCISSIHDSQNRSTVINTSCFGMNFGMKLTPRCGCDLCSAAIISRAATGRVGSRKFPALNCLLQCTRVPPSRSDVNSYVTANVYYVTFRYPWTRCSRVFQSRLCHPWKFGPVFSSPAISTTAIWSHVFQSGLFQSRVFSVPLPSARLCTDHAAIWHKTVHCRHTLTRQIWA